MSFDTGLYDGQTGRLIKYLSCVPNAFGDGKLFGYDGAGIYFCDADGSDLISIDGEISPCSWDVEPDTGDNDVDGLDLYHFVNSTFDLLDQEGFASEFGRTDCFQAKKIIFPDWKMPIQHVRKTEF
nr:hypothetical protein [uncultured Desulfobacter sp.]